MSSRQSQLCFTSTSQPPAAQLGDEWFNPTTNRLYKFTAAFGKAPIWAELPIGATGTTNVTSLAVSGGTGSFAGSSSNLAMTINNAGELVSITGIALTGVTNYDVATQSIVYFTNVTGNWTINFRGAATTTLNNLMASGQSVTAVVLAGNGASAYVQSAITIDGVAVIPKWQGGTAPSTGNSSSIDAYTYTIIKTASSTYTVLASQTKFA